MSLRLRKLCSKQRLSLLACLHVALFILCYLSLWRTAKPDVCGIVCATSEKDTKKSPTDQATGVKAKLIPQVDVTSGRDQSLTLRHHNDLKADDMRYTNKQASLNELRYNRGTVSNEKRYENAKTSPAESDTRPKLERDRTSPTGSRQGEDDTSRSRPLPEHIQGATTTLPKQESATTTRPKHDQGATTTRPKHDQGANPTRPKHDQGANPTRPKHDQGANPTRPKHDQGATRTRPNSTSLPVASQDKNSTMNSSTKKQNKSTNIVNNEGYMQLNSSLYEKWTQEQELKKKHVQDTCKSLRSDSRSANLKYDLTEAVLKTLNHLLVVDSHKIIYCYVPKIGCTSWKRILLVLLEKIKRVEDVSHMGAHYTPIPNLSKFTLDEVKQRLRNYTTFMITRDPVERVVSCFRDKFEKDNPDNRALQRNVMPGIQGKSGNYNKSDKILPKVDFPQFARYVSDSQNIFGNYGPTEHWNEVYKMCHPCLVRYDFIGEFDKLTRDSELILKATGLENTVRFPKATNPTNSSGDSVTNKYLSLLNKTEITALNKRYEIDAELFGYSDQPVPL
ncbi:carbohydrate sulfotransferase 9-like [Asterias rubens]|uniref:carbohydrate sulfotransferase 9-like n=1 Tax=Asterias rubens TaxID=7604 RepID=UPI0014558A07|nr:carbohydrate sulfotransferase 9-like [Asterias rubens]